MNLAILSLVVGSRLKKLRNLKEPTGLMTYPLEGKASLVKSDTLMEIESRVSTIIR